MNNLSDGKEKTLAIIESSKMPELMKLHFTLWIATKHSSFSPISLSWHIQVYKHQSWQMEALRLLLESLKWEQLDYINKRILYLEPIKD